MGIAQNPCKIARKCGGLPLDAFSLMTVMQLIPTLDMTGRWSRNQAAGFITSFANDDTFSPGLNMFLSYAFNAHGVPLLPMPIAFANQYRIHFSNSTMVTSLSGGHLVSTKVGVDA